MQNENKKVQNVGATSFDKTSIVNILPDQIHRGFQEPPVEPRSALESPQSVPDYLGP